MKFNHSVLSIFSIAIAMLTACAPMLDGTPNKDAPVDISILAFNDFHGNLEPPHIAIREQFANETKDVPAGGAAYLQLPYSILKNRILLMQWSRLAT